MMESPNSERLRSQSLEIRRLHGKLQAVHDAISWTRTEDFRESVFDYESEHGPGSARYHVFMNRVKQVLESDE
jgi:hypothetical protein